MDLRCILTITFLIFLVACSTTQTPTPVSTPTETPIIELTVANPLMGINWTPHPVAENLIQDAGWTCNPQVRLRDGLTMFDENFEPKPAYFAVRDALRNTPLP